MNIKRRILWVDDEIGLLRPHILFLEGKGYEILTATNGIDALEIVRTTNLEAVLLDEMMTGLDGLAVLEKIKSIKDFLPVIMITKNEEETLMEDAIGRKITDYLLKPVNPSQVLMALKKVLERKDIRREAIATSYMTFYQDMNQELQEGIESLSRWADLHATLSRWETEFDRTQHQDLLELFGEQKRQLNQQFEKFIISEYEHLINDPRKAVCDSAAVLDTFIRPRLVAGEKVLFILIDCMRYDQWLMIAPLIQDYYNVDMAQHLSILPTATPYSRNAIFSGLYPSDIAGLFPEIYENADLDDSMNRFEGDLLTQYLNRHSLTLKGGVKYMKILDSKQGEQIAQHFSDFSGNQFISLVINFVDILAHRRSESSLLQEILPDESSYRNIIRNWFEHSYLAQIFRRAAELNYTTIVTSDHGSVKVRKSAVVKADRETTTGVRYKTGNNLHVPHRAALHIKEPQAFKLPSVRVNSHFIFAREDHYFVYPNNLRHYQKQLPDTFQHGGISLDEMILPVAVCTPK